MSTNKKTVPKGKKEQIEEIKQGQQQPQQVDVAQQLIKATNNQAQMLNSLAIDVKRLDAMLKIADKDRDLIWKELKYLERQLEK